MLLRPKWLGRCRVQKPLCKGKHMDVTKHAAAVLQSMLRKRLDRDEHGH